MGSTKIVKRQRLLITSMRAFFFWQYRKQSTGFHGYGGLRHSQIQTKKKRKRKTHLLIYRCVPFWERTWEIVFFSVKCVSLLKGKGRTVENTIKSWISGREHKLPFGTTLGSACLSPYKLNVFLHGITILDLFHTINTTHCHMS